MRSKRSKDISVETEKIENSIDPWNFVNSIAVTDSLYPGDIEYLRYAEDYLLQRTNNQNVDWGHTMV